MTILSIICENGLGHFKRAIGLLNALHSRVPNLKMHVLCTQNQITKIQGWDLAQILSHPNCKVYTDVISPGIHWSDDEATYLDNRLNNWTNRLRNFAPLLTADIVISDNLSGPLSIRPDTILMGSFLWSDVFENSGYQSATVQQFIQSEKKLLERYKPPMICVGAIAMPNVLKKTKSIKCPWFGHQKKMEHPDHAYLIKKIAILGGATPVVNKISKKIIFALLKSTPHEIIIPERTIKLLNLTNPQDKNRIIPFHFNLEEFLNCDLVFCRPGIGTMTDCVVTQTPMVHFYEKGNSEMEHNAKQMEKTGMALNLGTNTTTKAIAGILSKALATNRYTTIKEQLRNSPINGFEVAAKWILASRKI